MTSMAPKPTNAKGFGGIIAHAVGLRAGFCSVMYVTEPYECLGLGPMDVTKPLELIWFCFLLGGLLFREPSDWPGSSHSAACLTNQPQRLYGKGLDTETF